MKGKNSVVPETWGWDLLGFVCLKLGLLDFVACMSTRLPLLSTVGIKAMLIKGPEV